jgi:uncharacterized membrane protein YgdD (TMEM256/DUF423 family)
LHNNGCQFNYFIQNPMPKLSLPNVWRPIACLLGLTAVIVGALAAHVVSDPQAAQAVERAAYYQLIHAAVLLFATSLVGRTVIFAKCALLSGILLFSGSIYAKYLLHLIASASLAPAGGVLLMLGWLALAFSLPVNKK